MYSDLDEPNDHQFLSQQYRINQYRNEESQLSSQAYTPRQPIYLTNQNLNKKINLQTAQYKQMSQRNDFKTRKFEYDSKFHSQFQY